LAIVLIIAYDILKSLSFQLNTFVKHRSELLQSIEL